MSKTLLAGFIILTFSIHAGAQRRFLGASNMTVQEKVELMTRYLQDNQDRIQAFNVGMMRSSSAPYNIVGGPPGDACQDSAGNNRECSVNELRDKGFYVCDDNEMAYVCDKQAVVFCTQGEFRKSDGVDVYGKKKKGYHDDDNILDGCYYSQLPLKKRDVAPKEWAGDMNMCAFSSGTHRTTCQFVRAYHHVGNLGTVKNEIKSLNANKPFITSFAGESAATDRAIWEDKGIAVAREKHWSTDSTQPIPKAEPQPDSQDVPPQTQPDAKTDGPGDVCGQVWGPDSKCEDWTTCKQTATNKQLSLCSSCQLEDCVAAYETVASKFADFFDPNACQQPLKDMGVNVDDVKARAQAAANSIKTFRSAVANRPGFYAKDTERCFFARFYDIKGAGVPVAVGSKGPTLPATCDPDRASPVSLKELEGKLQAIAKQDGISALDGVTYTLKTDYLPVFSQVTALANYMQDHKNAPISQMFLQGVESNPESDLFKATQNLVKNLYKLQHSDGVVKFDQLISNPKYRPFFACTAKKSSNKDASAIRSEITKYNSEWSQRGHNQECLNAAGVSSADIFQRDINLERELNKVDHRCTPRDKTNDFPKAGTDKYNQEK